ncbi:MAG TPA: lytic transglycosylase domain-containing protein [Puia sp.]|nr:lytic transglycosylase domain-containing protein [Puia sp.]
MLKVPVYLTLVIGLPTVAGSGQPAPQKANAAPPATTRALLKGSHVSLRHARMSLKGARVLAQDAPVSLTTVTFVSRFAPPRKHSLKFVDAYIRNNNEDLAEIRQRSGRPFSIIDSVFTYYGLPTELKYLAVIESELKTSAVSRVGARGPWQLMAGTARDLGLKVKGRYDERTSFTKSTRAAALYLRDLHNEFKDWLLVLAAYNAGPLPVHRAIHRSGSRNFWALERYLPKESQMHVKRFIATAVYFRQMEDMSAASRSMAAL